MPIYDYYCETCGNTEEHHRKVDERHDPLSCAKCGDNMKMEVGAPHFGVLKMGVDSGFPTFYEKWGKVQRSKNSGKMKDSANNDASAKTREKYG